MTAGTYLAASGEAWIGETYHVGWNMPEDAANVTVAIEGGTSSIASFPVTERFGGLDLTVTSAWGSYGYVALSWTNGTGNATSPHEEQVSFRVMCGLTCQRQLAEENAAKAGQTAFAVAVVALLGSILFVAVITKVAAERSGRTPWTTSASVAVRSRFTRDPLYRSKRDSLGVLRASAPELLADL